MTTTYCNSASFSSTRLITTFSHTALLLSISIFMMSIVFLKQRSYTIASSSDFMDSIPDYNIKKHYKDPFIQPDDMMIQEPTSSTSIRIIRKLDEHNEDQKEGYNHLNDDSRMTTNVASFHRMTEDCVTNEDGLRLAVQNAPNGSSIAFEINLCVQYIAINSRINVFNKFIHFNCTLLINNATTMKEKKIVYT